MLHDDEVAFLLRISPEEWLKTKRIFIEKGFIDEGNNVINWNKRQFISDTSAERVARHREAKKNAEKASKKGDVTKCNVTVTPPDTYTEHIQNITYTEHIKENTRHKKHDAKELLSEYEINGQLAIDFINHRKSKKAPITKTVLDGISRESEKIGMNVADAVRMMIERNWQGFKADWVIATPINNNGANGYERKSRISSAEWFDTSCMDDLDP